jgi:hypothetical protein
VGDRAPAPALTSAGAKIWAVPTASVFTTGLSLHRPGDAGWLAEIKDLMTVPISTNARNTVATTPVVTGFDLLDWAISAVIYIPAPQTVILSESGIFRVDVRGGSNAYIALGPRHVRFTPESGHRSARCPCPLCGISGHCPTSPSCLFWHRARTSIGALTDAIWSPARAAFRAAGRQDGNSGSVLQNPRKLKNGAKSLNRDMRRSGRGSNLPHCDRAGSS